MGVYQSVQSQPDCNAAAKIYIDPYLLTTYQINDYIFRRYPRSKQRGGNPHKYGSCWRGPCQVMSVFQKPISDSLTTPRYTIRNLVTGKEYIVDITHICPFYFDPDCVTPLNSDERQCVVEKVVDHDFSN